MLAHAMFVLLGGSHGGALLLRRPGSAAPAIAVVGGRAAHARRDDLTEERVRAHWELLDARQAAEASAAPLTLDIAADATPAEVRQQLLSAGVVDEDELAALLLILGLAD